MVGATGFEPATSWSQTKCSTRLSYAPSTGERTIGLTRRPRNDYFYQRRVCKGSFEKHAKVELAEVSGQDLAER